MSERQEPPSSLTADELEREIRQGRKFTLEEGIARLAGPGALKGESPIARKQQAEYEIETWLRSHLTDGGGTLGTALNRRVRESELLLSQSEAPLAALAGYCQQLLESDFMLQRSGGPSHPDDPYTLVSVRQSLCQLVAQLAPAAEPKVE
jgi:hypothetical protein